MGSSSVLNGTNTTIWKMLPGSDFDPMLAREWMAQYWHCSFYLAGAYLIFLATARRFMRDRQPFQLTKQLIVWNVLLAVFSCIGTYYTLPEFISHLKKYGYFASYCVVDGYYLKEPSAYWVWAFHLSKAPELVDTIFLILRKKPVTFLHLFHHTSVVLWCWYCYPYQSAPPRWGVAMNYAVHTIMYAYYAARAARFRVPSFVAMMITLLQLFQFLACVPLNGLALYKASISGSIDSKSGGSVNIDGCETTLALVLWQQFLYSAYFLLFAQFFYKTYIEKGKRPGLKQE